MNKPMNESERERVAAEEEQIECDRHRHRRAQHAMQSGVAYEEAQGSPAVAPKHLRVGVNTALSDAAGLVHHLIDKGIITEAEYTKAVADEMEREVERYEARYLGMKFY